MKNQQSMKAFLDDNFLLHSRTAERLYHEYAAPMPIIDYHCHLSPELIATDHRFENLTQAWLAGDHYKWRAMRANGVAEDYCTGNRSDWEKFEQWAATVPYTLRNPLYHWTHLELQRYFGISELLRPVSASHIYEAATEQLQTPSHSVRNLLELMKVKVVCTTDDPIDDLRYHQQIAADNWAVKVLPAFRPDKAINLDDLPAFNTYLGKLEAASNISIGNYQQFLDALQQRHDFFATMGCSVSDHGLEQIDAEDYTLAEIQTIFDRVRAGKSVTAMDKRRFRSALLIQLAQWDAAKGWVQQFHLGAMRNNNSRMVRSLGPDTGWDSIGDYAQGQALAKFLDRLDVNGQLTKTILYNLNPSDNELMASMIGNFNDGSVAGKIQWGSAWWFLDQKEGMTRQLNALSHMGLLSRFVGMLTDSRSFLSFPRHEYFRRILCDLFGSEMERGELPDDIEWVGQIIQNICYHNASEYFNWR